MGSLLLVTAFSFGDSGTNQFLNRSLFNAFLLKLVINVILLYFNVFMFVSFSAFS